MKKRSVFEICVVEGCSNITFATSSQYCHKHYLQMKRHGKIKRSIYDPNEIEILEDCALIHLYDKHCNVKAKAIIDLEDVAKASEHKWALSDVGYVHKTGFGYLHHFVMNHKGEIDHADHNPLNNRKENLRPCTRKQNMHNLSESGRSSTGAKGVVWNKQKDKYIAVIKVGKKNVRLGIFDDLKEASDAYDQAAILHFGDFACLNNL